MGGRVVECARLESVLGLKAHEGSNPSPSASTRKKPEGGRERLGNHLRSETRRALRRGIRRRSGENKKQSASYCSWYGLQNSDGATSLSAELVPGGVLSVVSTVKLIAV